MPPPARLLRIGEATVPFRVRTTTMGECSLAGYRGRWLMLFSIPRTSRRPACRNSSRSPGCSHASRRWAATCWGCRWTACTWVGSIRAAFGVEIPFPIAEDLSISIAAAYGMIHPADTDTATVRATFLIDPTGIVRLLTYYPMATGRNLEELIRALAALQELPASRHRLDGSLATKPFSRHR